MSRAREEVWRYAQKEFNCELCKCQRKPDLNRPALIPRSYAPGRTVGVDVVYFPGVAPNETIPVLNIIDWASCYQVLEPLDGVSAEHVWWKFMKSWGRIFSIPEMVVMDQGREFLGAFSTRINEAGAVVKTIGARAPHQQGRTERRQRAGESRQSTRVGGSGAFGGAGQEQAIQPKRLLTVPTSTWTEHWSSRFLGK